MSRFRLYSESESQTVGSIKRGDADAIGTVYFGSGSHFLLRKYFSSFLTWQPSDKDQVHEYCAAQNSEFIVEQIDERFEHCHALLRNMLKRFWPFFKLAQVKCYKRSLPLKWHVWICLSPNRGDSDYGSGGE